ncbi:MAG TPA: BatA domain-containing protein [Fimbriiglobus sp.]|jgi:hypothetical protein
MHPVLIAGVALVGLPVLLHLIMKQEPKRVLFPAFRFLKQKRNLNQRKLRLRHFLLLALRMLLIALFAVMLFQPTVYSDGVLPLAGEQPVAVVVLIDTTPSMGYMANGKTRLDDAKRRALELLDDLPTGSRVAVLDPTDPVGTWEQSVADARRAIEAIAEPKGGGPAITAGLPVAYQLMRDVDRETDAKEPMPKLIAVFTDRAVGSWAADRVEELKKQRDAVPLPKVAHLLFDVGVDEPANVGITAVDVDRQVVPVGATVKFAVTVSAAGSDVVAAVRREYEGTVETKEVRVTAGSAKAVLFELKGLAKGVHQVRFSLATDDNLPADNQRYVTIEVAEPRKILTICDDPADAFFWSIAHDAVGEFEAVTRKPGDVDSIAGYESVTLLGVADPTKVWDVLFRYVEGGGKLFIAPGRAVGPGYGPTNPFAKELMPAKLGRVIDTAGFPPPANPSSPDRRSGVTWALDDAALRHPLLGPFKDWIRQGNIDVVKRPPRAFKYYAAEPLEGATVAVRFNDEDDPAKRHPALLERAVGKAGGKVLLLTTRLDVTDAANPWNNYFATSDNAFATVFPHVVMTYLCGAAADKTFNFPTGRDLVLRVPRNADGAAPKKLLLEGPGVSGSDAEFNLGDKQTEIRIGASKTLTAGNYLIATDRGEKSGFSLNPAAEESNLVKVPAAAIEDLFGPNSVIPLGKDAKLRDVLKTKFNQPVDLFPWLLILVLLLLAAEGVIANRFYRPVR